MAHPGYNFWILAVNLTVRQLHLTVGTFIATSVHGNEI